jgi:CBS domain-containing protein
LSGRLRRITQHPILILIAVFIFLGAAGEASASQLRSAFHGLPTSTGMVTDFKGLTFDDTLGHAVELLLRGDQIDFPVLEDGRVAGMLTRQQLVASLHQSGPGARLRDITLKEVEPIDADLPLSRAYEEMNRQGTRCLPVLQGGRLVGLITTENIAELAMVRQALDRPGGEQR